MEIRTKRLCLRPVTMDDVESTYAYASDLENTRYMVGLPYASPEETAEAVRRAVAEWGSDHPAFREFAIVKDGAHIGGLTLYFLEPEGEAELGWILHRDHWRRGYISEAVEALIEYARQRWGIRRFIAQCDSENVASYRLMEKLGMRRVSCTGGRRNRSMDEERLELTYELIPGAARPPE